MIMATEEDNRGDAVTGKVRISDKVYEGLEAVRQSGQTNMLDRPNVARIASEFGFYETADWVENNRRKYAEGIFKGFEIDNDARDR